MSGDRMLPKSLFRATLSGSGTTTTRAQSRNYITGMRANASVAIRSVLACGDVVSLVVAMPVGRSESALSRVLWERSDPKKAPPNVNGRMECKHDTEKSYFSSTTQLVVGFCEFSQIQATVPTSKTFNEQA